MTVCVRIQRSALRKINIHVNEVARSRGVETIGWLLGFFGRNEVWVCDSVPATRYKSQSRYGAHADAREEVELALQYPRNVGIVGLFHSHPFRDESEHAVFHSATDDSTLKSRASRHENYLSIVTDGTDTEFFVLRDGAVPVKAEVVESISYKEEMKSYRCPLAFILRRETTLPRVDSVPGYLEQEMLALIERDLRGDGLRVNKESNTIEVPALQGGAESNSLAITKSGSTAMIELEMILEPIVFVRGGNVEDLRTAVKNEILDDVVFLLWHSLGGGSSSLEGVKSFEANLGSFRVHETSPLPKKIFKPPKRAAVLTRGE